MKRYLFLSAIIGICLTACNKVDDLMLGQDNTKQPAPLVDFKSGLNVQTLWSTTIGEGTKGSYLKIQPSVQDQTIYSADAKGTVVAFNRANGVGIWSTKLAGNLVSGPSVGGKYLAVAGRDAQISVLNAANGKVLWTKAVSNEVLAPPTIAANKILAKTVDGNVYAFELSSGKRLWKYEHSSPGLILRTGSSPQVSGHTVVVGFSDGRLDGLDLASGNLLWQRDIAIPQGTSDVERMVDIDSNPIINNGVVYVATYHGYVAAMDLNTGEFNWKHKSSTFSNIALTSAYLILADSKDNIWAFDRKTGGVIWRQKQLQGRGLTAPTIQQKSVVIADAQGVVHWLDINDGHFVARASSAKSAIYAAPIVSGNKVYILNSAGTLVAYKVRT